MIVIDFTASAVTGNGMRARVEALRGQYSPLCSGYFDELLRRRGSAFCDSASGFLLLDSLLQKNRIDRASFPIIIGENARPFVDLPNVDFSVSHSEGCVLCVLAVGENAAVGCDVQHKREYSDDRMKELARAFMTESEFKNLEDSDDKELEFFTAWTRRESYVKRVGSDIFDNLRTADLRGESFREGIIHAFGEKYYYSINLPNNEEIHFLDEPVKLTASED